MSEGILYGVFGNLVEYNTLGLFEADGFGEMPCNGLALAVGVRREYHFVRLFCFLVESINHVLFFFHHLISRHKSTLDVDGVFVRLRQVANVSHRSADSKSFA